MASGRKKKHLPFQGLFNISYFVPLLGDLGHDIEAVHALFLELLDLFLNTLNDSLPDLRVHLFHGTVDKSFIDSFLQKFLLYEIRRFSLFYRLRLKVETRKLIIIYPLHLLEPCHGLIDILFIVMLRQKLHSELLLGFRVTIDIVKCVVLTAWHWKYEDY